MRIRTIHTLRKSAQESCSFRNHRMQWTEVYYAGYDVRGVKKASQRGTCRDCGMKVWLRTHPMPNEIDIGGEAVALNCTKQFVRDYELDYYAYKCKNCGRIFREVPDNGVCPNTECDSHKKGE